MALVAGWIVYRLQRDEEREGVLAALVAELQIHEDWVGRGGYTQWSDDWWHDMLTGEMDWHRTVFKLSTVATDNAIQVGPSLFINQSLVRALVQYRQRANQLNQLIDDVAAFRATPELWIPSANQKELRRQLGILVQMVHMSGIADEVKFPYGANHSYHAVRRALRAERCASGWHRAMWFWFGRAQRAKDTPDASW
ncbi:MAG: hypothetical protein ACHQ9S_27185 [Candidatus Binatia bacterium]